MCTGREGKQMCLWEKRVNGCVMGREGKWMCGKTEMNIQVRLMQHNEDGNK